MFTLSPSAHWAFVPVGANEVEEKSLEGVRNSDSAATCLVSRELNWDCCLQSANYQVLSTQPCGPTVSLALLSLLEHQRRHAASLLACFLRNLSAIFEICYHPEELLG